MKTKTCPLALALLMACSVFVAEAVVALPQVEVYSSLATNPPAIDGSYTPGEWPSAAAFELIPPDYPIHTKVYILNDDRFLYLFVDAADLEWGDYTEENGDHCTVYLYNNGRGTSITVSGGGNLNCQSTDDATPPLTWTSASCLAQAAAGFGQGPDIAPDHRMYEFKIPLDLIGAAPGSSIYFSSPPTALDSLPYDWHNGEPRVNTWPPSTNPSSFDTWAILHLAQVTAIPTMTPWGMIVFVFFLIFFGLWILRSRKTA
jgi:hypothetical protein